MLRSLLRWPVLLLAATGVSLASVSVSNWMGGYGFPLAIRNGGCPPPGIVVSTSCFLAIGSDWLGFGLDILFYTLIGYALIVVAARYRRRELSRIP